MTQPRVKASGPRDAKIAIVGMAPAREEVREGRPFATYGAAGQILNKTLSQLMYPRENVFVTNVLEFPIKTGESVFSSTPPLILAEEIDRLRKELIEVNPNVIVPLGADPLKVICGRDGIIDWRGSILESTLLPGKKCVPTVHPAWIVRGMWKWLSIFSGVDLKRAIEESEYPEIRLPSRVALVGPSLIDAIAYMRHLVKAELPISVDIETRGPEIVCWGFGNRIDEAMCIPVTHGDLKPYWSLEEEVDVYRGIAELMESPTPKVMQNASFEWLFSWRHKIFPHNLWIDTMTLHHCLYPDFGQAVPPLGLSKRATEEPGHSLAFINSQYTKTPYYKDDRKEWWKQNIGINALWEYNCKDVMCTLDAGLQMFKEAVGEGLWEFYKEFYIRPFIHTMRTEWIGTPIDEKLRVMALSEANTRLLDLQSRIYERVGWPLNVKSPNQMRRLLYEEKGYQVKKNRKTGKPTADRATLEYFAEVKGDETLRLVVELGKVRDLISDVLSKEYPDGRIRTHYRIGGTTGARWSSVESLLGPGGNLQNIPKKGVARKLFIPD